MAKKKPAAGAAKPKPAKKKKPAGKRRGRVENLISPFVKIFHNGFASAGTEFEVKARFKKGPLQKFQAAHCLLPNHPEVVVDPAKIDDSAPPVVVVKVTLPLASQQYLFQISMTGTTAPVHDSILITT